MAHVRQQTVPQHHAVYRTRRPVDLAPWPLSSLRTGLLIGVPLLLGLVSPPQAGAQRTTPIDMRNADLGGVVDEHRNFVNAKADSQRQRQLHLVHVSPHLLLFDAHTQTATLTFSNPTDHPAWGTVLVVFPYLDWPHSHPADTAVLLPDYRRLLPYDTVLLDPGPDMPFAGRWLTGVPSQVTLAPHQTQQVTVQLQPPPQLPPGAYWARILVISRPPPLDRRRLGGHDAKMHYAVPIHNPPVLPPDTLRDSVTVWYQPHIVRPRLAFGPGARAVYDTPHYRGPHGGHCSDAIWLRLPVQLTGAPRTGRLFILIRNLKTGDLTLQNIYSFKLYRSGVTHWWAHVCCEIEPGKSQAVVQFVGDPLSGGPGGTSLAPDTVTYTVPNVFEIPAAARRDYPSARD